MTAWSSPSSGPSGSSSFCWLMAMKGGEKCMHRQASRSVVVVSEVFRQTRSASTFSSVVPEVGWVAAYFTGQRAVWGFQPDRLHREGERSRGLSRLYKKMLERHEREEKKKRRKILFAFSAVRLYLFTLTNFICIFCFLSCLHLAVQSSWIARVCQNMWEMENTPRSLHPRNPYLLPCVVRSVLL